MQLFGPFATIAAISCSGKPYSQTVVTAHGDGTLHSPPVKITSAGFYPKTREYGELVTAMLQEQGFPVKLTTLEPAAWEAPVRDGLALIG